MLRPRVRERGRRRGRGGVSRLLGVAPCPSRTADPARRGMFQLMLDLAHIAPAVATAFFASAVEAVEAVTIVLAAGITRGWRSSLAGAFGALVVLAAIVVVFGAAIVAVPVAL